MLEFSKKFLKMIYFVNVVKLNYINSTCSLFPIIILVWKINREFKNLNKYKDYYWKIDETILEFVKLNRIWDKAKLKTES